MGIRFRPHKTRFRFLTTLRLPSPLPETSLEERTQRITVKMCFTSTKSRAENCSEASNDACIRVLDIKLERENINESRRNKSAKREYVV